MLVEKWDPKGILVHQEKKEQELKEAKETDERGALQDPKETDERGALQDPKETQERGDPRVQRREGCSRTSRIPSCGWSHV